jgi:FkbH-like protein
MALRRSFADLPVKTSSVPMVPTLSDDAIAIAATFTAEPIAESLRFWLNWLNFPIKIEFASYNHVIQSLLDSESVFASNKRGLNVVLIRFEDWERFRIQTTSGDDSDARKQNSYLIAALSRATLRGTSPILVCVCPSSPQALSDPVRMRFLRRLEQDLEAGIEGLPMIRFLSTARLLELYPVTNYYDASTDKLGHIPYTPDAYVALGTAIARVFHASRRPPYKVIVLDCDNTLWRGICAENGARGIVLDAPSCAVQNFMKARQEEGMLLCVCSKNATEDVEQTFEAHPEMPLNRSDFVGWRVNWRPKSENIRSLSAELSLDLDSFIFVDDNPMETAEVEAACPGVLTLTLPAEGDSIPRFLEHVWAFDRSAITAEDRRRSAMYRENALRSELLAKSFSYADFLAGLELEIEIRQLRDREEIVRAAQMTQRTNQFNLTTRRYTESEMRVMLSGGSTKALTVFVRDRFGDYGQTGLLTYEAAEDVLRVHNMLLSCRVLGKGVEHAMVARLGQIAVTQSLSAIEIAYVPTPRNTPARNFLETLQSGHREDYGQEVLYRISADAAAALEFSPAQSEPDHVTSHADPDLVSQSSTLHTVADFARIATQYFDTASILQAVNDSQQIRLAAPVAVPPGDELQKRLSGIWQRVLRISPVGIHDNFFELGGDSLAAVRILSDVEAITGYSFPLVALIEAPTIGELAELVRDARSERLGKCLVPIKSSGARPAFFCVHGVGGNVLELIDLARHVHADQPFYGIQAVGLAGRAPERKLTVEEMARHYIREVRELQPEGPYFLGGSSFGGLVAYEMARQLEDVDQRVALVALFDTSAPGCPSRETSAWRHRVDTLLYRVTLHWKNVQLLGPGERMAYVRQKTRRFGRLVGYHAGLFRNRFRSQGRGISAFRAIQAANDAGHWSAADYAPAEYSGGITIFRATEQPPWIISDRTLGWIDLVKGGIEIYDTPGHHADLVRDPRARVLAEQLADALAKAHAQCRLDSGRADWANLELDGRDAE